MPFLDVGGIKITPKQLNLRREVDTTRQSSINADWYFLQSKYSKFGYLQVGHFQHLHHSKSHSRTDAFQILREGLEY